MNRPRSAPALVARTDDWNNGGFFGWGWGSQPQYGNTRAGGGQYNDPRQNGQYYRQQQNGQYYYQQQNGPYYYQRQQGWW